MTQHYTLEQAKKLAMECGLLENFDEIKNFKLKNFQAALNLAITQLFEPVYQVMYDAEIGAAFEDTDKEQYDKHSGPKRIVYALKEIPND